MKLSHDRLSHRPPREPQPLNSPEEELLLQLLVCVAIIILVVVVAPQLPPGW